MKSNLLHHTNDTPICIVVVIGIMSGDFRQKADTLQTLESSSPDCVMASKQDTTGVFEQGMFLKG